MELRVEFSKKGMIKYISHLDTLRVFSRAMKRGNIPVEWSEGFNPHMKLTLAVPLSVGIESEREILDVVVQEDFDGNMLKERLNGVLPDGIRILKVYEKKSKESFFETVSFITYEFRIPLGDSDSPEKIQTIITTFLNKEEVLVPRKKKQKRKRIMVEENIRPKVRELFFRQEEDIGVIRAMLQSGSSGNLRPDHFLTGLFSETDIDPNTISITRINFYDEKGEILAG